MFRVEKKESFRVIGYRIHTTNQKKEGRSAIPALWEEIRRSGKLDTLLPLMNQQPHGVFGISVYNTDSQDARKFDYYVAVSSDMPLSEELASYEVSAGLWAVFPCTRKTMGKTQAMAISKWLPKSKYRALNKGYITGRMKSNACDIEYYGKEDDDLAIWIAVEEK